MSERNYARRTKLVRRTLITIFGVFWALITNTPSIDAQTAPQVATPTIVSTGSDQGDMHTRADTVLPSMRYHSQIDVSQTSVTLDQLDPRSVELDGPNQIGVNRGITLSSKSRAQKFLNTDGSQIIVWVIKSTNAYGIGVHFRGFDLAGDDEVYVYGPASDSIVCGPFTKKGPWGDGEFCPVLLRRPRKERRWQNFVQSGWAPCLHGHFAERSPAKIISRIFSLRIIAYQIKLSLERLKYGGFIRPATVTAACCGMASCTPPRTPIYW